MRYITTIILTLALVAQVAWADVTSFPYNENKFAGVDYYIQVARGLVPGHSLMHGLGERENIQVTATGEDIWRGNELSSTPQAVGSHTSIPIPAEVGERMTFVSQSDADNGATATGILTLQLVYLDAAGDRQTEVITMDGIAQVDTLADDIRFVQDLQALTVGSNGVAEGHIRIFRETDETRVYSMIAAGGNQSLVPHKMVPRDKTLHLTHWLAAEASSQKRVYVRLRADSNGAAPPVRQSGVFLFKAVIGLNSSVASMELARAIPEFSIVKASGWARTTGAEATVHWLGVLIDN